MNKRLLAIIAASVLLFLTACASQVPYKLASDAETATFLLEKRRDTVENEFEGRLYADAYDCSKEIKLPKTQNIFNNIWAKTLRLEANKDYALLLESARYEGPVRMACVGTYSFTPEANAAYTIVFHVEDNGCAGAIYNTETKQLIKNFKRRQTVITGVNTVQLSRACEPIAATE